MDICMVFNLIDRVTDLAEQIFEGNRQKAFAWMIIPQVALDGQMPRIMCLRGHGDLVLSHLEDVLSN